MIIHMYFSIVFSEQRYLSNTVISIYTTASKDKMLKDSYQISGINFTTKYFTVYNQIVDGALEGRTYCPPHFIIVMLFYPSQFYLHNA